MKIKTGVLKTMAAGAAVAALVGCAVQLLWSTVVETGSPLTATTLAVDAENNSYVGGIEITVTEMHGILIKHDAQGKLLWQVEWPQSKSVEDVQPLNDDVLAVLSRELGSLELDESPSELWLVSAHDGSRIAQLETADEQYVHKLAVANGKLYVATTHIDGICGFFGCNSSASDGSAVSVYDEQGNLLQARAFTDRNLQDVKVRADGTVFLLTTRSATLIKLDVALVDQWELDLGAARCWGHGLLAGDAALYVDCGGGVLQVSAQGEAGAYTDFAWMQKSFPANSEEPSWQQFFLVDTVAAQVAPNGDLYLARARPKVFARDSRVGPLVLQLPAVLEADTVLLKVNAGAGGIAWHDTIHTPIFAGATTITSHFYYPLALHLAQDKVRLTFRGFVGEYAGSGEENLCADITDLEILINSCRLDNARERYAKTQDFRMTDGKRLQSVRYEVPYPRVVVQSSNGNLILVGDDLVQHLSDFNEFFIWGNVAVWEGPAPVNQSNLYLQAAKP